MAQICELRPSDPVKQPDHVLIVRHDDGKFEVSGTVGAGKPDAQYLTPTPFDDKEDAMVCAQSFADAHNLLIVHIKGFRMEADA